MPRMFSFIASLMLALLVTLPLHAENPAPPAASPEAAQPAGDAAKTEGGSSETRIARMRDRWRKMTPEQRDEMRQKASRRLQERYERLNPQDQAQVNGLIDQVNKLNREQRSIFMAKIHQKAYQERTERRLLQDQATKPLAEPAVATPASAPAVAVPSTAPAAPAPAAPAAPAKH